MALLIVVTIIILLCVAFATAAYLSDRPVRKADQEIRKENKALEAENLRLRALVNNLDGMAQLEYDVSSNLFAHTVRQAIVNNRKEIA